MTSCNKKTRTGLEPSGYMEEGQTNNEMEKGNRIGTAHGRMKLKRSKRTSLVQNQIGELSEGRTTHTGRLRENDDDYDDDDDDDDESGGACGT